MGDTSPEDQALLESAARETIENSVRQIRSGGPVPKFPFVVRKPVKPRASVAVAMAPGPVGPSASELIEWARARRRAG